MIASSGRVVEKTAHSPDSCEGIPTFMFVDLSIRLVTGLDKLARRSEPLGGIDRPAPQVLKRQLPSDAQAATAE